MDAVDGVIPQDVLPYNFGDNWLFDASPEDQQPPAGGDASTCSPSCTRSPTPRPRFGFLDPVRTATRATPRCSGTSPARAPGTSSRSPTSAARRLVERALRVARRPLCPPTRARPCCAGATRASATCIYRDFEPVAVLDWEMAALGPRELDVALAGLRPPGVRGRSPARSSCRACPTSCATDDVRCDVRTADRRTRSATSRGSTSSTPVQWCVVFMRTGRAPDPLRRDRAARRHRDAVPPQAAARRAAGRGRSLRRRGQRRSTSSRVHQAPLSMRVRQRTSDRNAYDRCYFNVHDRTGDLFLIIGLGVLPEPRRQSMRTRTVRRGDEQIARALLGRARTTDRLDQHVGGVPHRGASSRCSGCASSATRRPTGSAST